MAKKTIQEETILMPYIIADRVIGEHLRNANINGKNWMTVYDTIADKLVNKADRLFNSSEYFRKQIKANNGRENLLMFFNHWIKSIIHESTKVSARRNS